jgi:hypothetical protein
MSISHLFTKDIVICRYSTVTGNRKSFQATATVEGMIQNKDVRKSTLQGIIEDRQWIAYLEIDCDIKIGDQIIDKYGKKFSVMDFSKKDYGINQHIEAILDEVNE